MLSTNTPYGRLRPESLPPSSIRSLKSCRVALTFAVIVCPGRIESSSGLPGSCVTEDRSSPGRISTVSFGCSASWTSPIEPRSWTTSRPSTKAFARTVTALSAASSGGMHSSPADSTPIAFRWPAGISIGPWKTNPAGKFSTVITIGPLKPSARVAVNTSSRPLPGLTFGSLPATATVNAGAGGRIASA